jgi:hypothetical protein
MMYKNSVVVFRGLSAYFAGALRICLSAIASYLPRSAHPQEDHLVPLFVAVGPGGGRTERLPAGRGTSFFR